MYICCLIIVEPICQILLLRCSWILIPNSEEYLCIYIIYKDIFCVLKWRPVYEILPLDVAFTLKN